MKTLRGITFSLIGVFLWLFCQPAAFAWGADGHRVTGNIAAQLLAPATRVHLNELYPAVNLADLSTWMDEERLILKHQLPHSEKWHFINIPVCGGRDFDRICYGNDCAPARIRQYQTVLADKHGSVEERRLALKLLVHMVGDIHQPLYVADNHDAGGNAITIGRGKNTLHHEWDESRTC